MKFRASTLLFVIAIMLASALVQTSPVRADGPDGTPANNFATNCQQYLGPLRSQIAQGDFAGFGPSGEHLFVMTKDRKTRIREGLEEFYNQEHLEKIDRLYDAGITCHQSPFPEFNGKDELKGYVRDLLIIYVILIPILTYMIINAILMIIKFPALLSATTNNRELLCKVG